MDLKLISGDFLHDDSVPPSDRWLFIYFRSAVQRRFLAYQYQFSGLLDQGFNHFYANFVNHTGILCTKNNMHKLIKSLRDLLLAVEIATENFDLETLEKIKTGKFRAKNDSTKKSAKGDNSDGGTGIR